MPIPSFNTPLTLGTAGQVLQTDGGDPKGEINTSWVDKGGSGGLLTAVVDIGPTTNTGPGDQTKGILDWGTVSIDLVAAPGATKENNILQWHVQYKPGTLAYVGDNNLFVQVGDEGWSLSADLIGLHALVPTNPTWLFILNNGGNNVDITSRANK